jgi:hypothetical protein
MSEIGDAARVSILLADYARNDETGKGSILGAGWQITSLQPETGLTNPCALYVTIGTPPAFYDEQYATEIVLMDDASGDVAVNTRSAPEGPIRIAQTVTAEAPSFPGRHAPPRVLWARSQFAINFAGGLPLEAGKSYTWQVRIDGDVRAEATFAVGGTPPPLVIG